MSVRPRVHVRLPHMCARPYVGRRICGVRMRAALLERVGQAATEHRKKCAHPPLFF